MQCIPPMDIRRCWPELMIRFIMKAERWERYLNKGVLETADLSFSTPSWAGVASRPLLLSRQPEARHPTEADSVPPGFTRIN